MRKRNKNKRQQQTNKASTSNKDLNCDTSVAALPGGNGCYYVEEPATSSLPSSSGVPHGVGSSEGVGGLGGQQSSHHQFNHGMSHQHRPSSTTSKESETEMTTSGYLRYLQPLHHSMVNRPYYVISVPNRQNPFMLVLIRNELRAFSESLGPPGSRPHPIMTIAGL